MSTLVYGPDEFTVGANTDLSAYNADWVDASIGGVLGILAADDFLRISTVSTAAFYTYDGAGSPTGDQRIVADVRVANSGAAFGVCQPGLRSDGTNEYYVCLDNLAGTLSIKRWDAGAETVLATTTLLTSLGGVSTVNFSAIGTGASVVLTANVTGHATLTATDTSGSRITSGKPFLLAYDDNSAANRAYFDNISIYDETVTVDNTGKPVSRSWFFS